MPSTADSRWFPHLLLIVVRLAGVVVLLPGWGTPVLSVGGRVLVCAMLTLLLVPLAPTAYVGQTLGDAILQLPAEFGLGAAMGFGVLIMLEGAHLAGQLISRTSGLSLAASLAGGSPETKDVLIRLFHLTWFCILFASGSHRQIVSLLLDSFVEIPPGTAVLTEASAYELARFLTVSFSCGVQAALPLLGISATAIVVLAVLGRLMPQLNVLAASAGLGSLLLTTSLALGFGVLAAIMHDQLPQLVDQLAQVAGSLAE